MPRSCESWACALGEERALHCQLGSVSFSVALLGGLLSQVLLPCDPFPPGVSWSTTGSSTLCCKSMWSSCHREGGEELTEGA